MIALIIDRVALAKQGDNRIGSIHPSICLSVHPSVCVCLLTLSHLNRLTLIFGMVVDPDLEKAGLLDQDRRSKIKVKC